MSVAPKPAVATVHDQPGTGNSSVQMAVAAAVYLALGALGISLAIAPSYASPIFPAAGFAVALLLHAGRTSWPAIWIGALALNLGLAWLHGDAGWRSALLAAGIASGSTLQALAASALVRRYVGDGWRTLENERDIVRCLALAGPLACTVSASWALPLLYWANMVHGNEGLYTWWNWWSGDTMGVLVALPLSLAALNWRKSPWRGRMTTQVLPMLIVLALVGAAFNAVAQWERAQQKQTIENHGEALAQLLEQRFIAHREAIAALSRLVEVSPEMSYRQFENFTRITLQDNPDLFALSFNPLVALKDRAAFEREMAERTGNRDYEIKERDDQRQLVRATSRPDYVAVGFIAPLAGNHAALGYDIGSEAIRRNAINRALRSSEQVVTAPIQLVQESRQHVGVLLLDPAHQTTAGSSEETVTGFSIGVIKVGQMVEIATRFASAPGLVFRIDDAQAPADSSLLFASDPAASPTDRQYLWRKKLLMADRTWTLSVFPSAGYLRAQHHYAALLAGAGGLVLAALLQVLLLITTGRTAIVQRRVREQTAELQAKSDALEDRNAQLHAIFSVSPDAFVAFGHDGNVKFVNPAFQTMTGITAEDLIGRNASALDDELRRRCEQPERYDTVASYFGEPLAHRTLNLKMPRQAVLQVVGIRSEASSIARILYFRDVTHESEVDHMKSEFLSTAAHELRTPMASIYGFAEVLLAQDLDAASRQEFIEIIFKQSELMATILNELLDLARIEARRGKDFVFKPTPVRELVAAVVSGFKLPAGRTAPILTMADAPLDVIADDKKAGQAILNVLSNAYKYSAAGSPVSISVERSPSHVDIRIADLGIGMSPAQLGRVCERFYRADSSGKVPGTGLGMSIVKEIVDLHGGELLVRSEIGAGTTVTIRLPVAPEAPHRSDSETS